MAHQKNLPSELNETLYLINYQGAFNFSTKFLVISFLYVCMANTILSLALWKQDVKLIIAKLSIRKLGSLPVPIIITYY